MKSKDQHILVGDTSFGASCILAGSMVKSTNSFLCGGTVYVLESTIFNIWEGVILQSLA